MTTFLLLFSIILYWLLKNKAFTEANKRYVTFITILLIIVSGLRHEGVGNDTLAYMTMYENMGSTSWPEVLYSFVSNYLNPLDNGVKDPGYRVFSKAVYTLLPDARLYLFIVATALLVPLGIFVQRYSKSLETTLFFYIFYIPLFYGYLPNSAIRQSLALSLVLIAYMFLERKKLYLFTLFILLGSMIHKSCLICFLLIPVFKFINEKYFYKVGIILFFVALIFSDQMAMLFMDQNEIYDGYLSGGYYGAANGSKPITVVFLFFVLYAVGWFGITNNPNTIERKLFYIGTTFTLVFVPLVWVNPSLLRVISYFSPFMGIIVGEAFGTIPKGKLIRTVVILVFILHSLSAAQYCFMWEDMKLHERYGYVMPENNMILNFKYA